MAALRCVQPWRSLLFDIEILRALDRLYHVSGGER